METIKNYLEAMFANMPNTPEVMKAKAELLSMMEDKYNEMIADGVSENEAVGTVISEFGNLDELAEDLGLVKEVEEVHVREVERPRRFVELSEVQDYLDGRKLRGIMIGAGVFLCVISVIFPIIADEFAMRESYGILGMFISIAVAIGLFIFSGIIGNDFRYLQKELCQIDMSTAEYVKDKKNDSKYALAMMQTIGIILCVVSWLPAAVFDNKMAPVCLFVMVGIGLFLIIYSAKIKNGYNTILNLNDATTISGTYGKELDAKYISRTAEVFMSVYWSTITCIYLIVSFVTMNWGSTWLIWIIAAIVHKILKVALVKED